LYYIRTSFVTQSIGGLVERLITATKRVLGNHKLFSEQWLRTTATDYIAFSHSLA